MTADPVTLRIDDTLAVGGLWQRPDDAFACYVLAHGAGAGMNHPFMSAVANGLSERGIATLRFQFPYMEAGSKRPDRPAIAHAVVRTAVTTAAGMAAGLPLFAGGKSFGGRMTSQTQAEHPMSDVRGLIFLGFPLHAAKKPSDDRAAHLMEIRVPMFFAQGTRDALADMGLLPPLIERLGADALYIEQADHSFHVPARTGRTDAQVMAGMLDDLGAWVRGIVELKA